MNVLRAPKLLSQCLRVWHNNYITSLIQVATLAWRPRGPHNTNKGSREHLDTPWAVRFLNQIGFSKVAGIWYGICHVCICFFWSRRVTGFETLRSLRELPNRASISMISMTSTSTKEKTCEWKRWKMHFRITKTINTAQPPEGPSRHQHWKCLRRGLWL